MQRIIDYTYLLNSMMGKPNKSIIGSFQLSQLNSSSVQAQLKAAGINTNSKQYKAVIGSMMQAGNGMMYTNIQCIKNGMSQYDSEGDYICPVTGLAGLLLTDENMASRDRIISIPESSREEMFNMTKKEFIRENGVLNGDTTKRSDVYTNMYRKVVKNDRLAAGHTMEQYERAYRQALVDAVKAADPNWNIGECVNPDVLKGVTRGSVEASLKQSGSSLTKASLNVKA